MSLFPDFLLPGSYRSIRRVGLIIAAIALLAACFGIEASAQSGRRGTGASTANQSTTPLASTGAPNTETASARATPEPKLRLLVARQLTSKHLMNEDAIAVSFFKRLAAYVDVDCISIGDIKQAQAQARAKSEKEAFIVLLKFDINSYQSGTIILNSPDLEIEYFAFAPQTGKKHVKGKVYFQTIGGGRMQKSGWPNGTPIRITPEAAGIEAAETLYHLLAIKTRMPTRP